MGYPYFGVSDAPKSVCAAFGSGRSCAFNMSDDSFYHYRECVCDFFTHLVFPKSSEIFAHLVFT